MAARDSLKKRVYGPRANLWNLSKLCYTLCMFGTYSIVYTIAFPLWQERYGQCTIFRFGTETQRTDMWCIGHAILLPVDEHVRVSPLQVGPKHASSSHTICGNSKAETVGSFRVPASSLLVTRPKRGMVVLLVSVASVYLALQFQHLDGMLEMLGTPSLAYEEATSVAQCPTVGTAASASGSLLLRSDTLHTIPRPGANKLCLWHICPRFAQRFYHCIGSYQIMPRSGSGSRKRLETRCLQAFACCSPRWHGDRFLHK